MCTLLINAKRRPRNPLKQDPTRTTTLRRVMERDLLRRFEKLKKAIHKLLVKEDAFGLIINQRFAFNTRPQQLALFQQWLTEQMEETFQLPKSDKAGDIEEIFLEKYIEQGYKKGAGRAFDDTRKAGYLADSERVADFYEGTKDEFLRSSFAQPISKEKIRVLASRAMTDLKGVAEATATRIQRSLLDGLVQGQNPRQIAKTIADDIDKVGKHRATLIARTEIIRAHAEGQLDVMEQLGVEAVGVQVEWSTAEDDRVCPLCEPLDGIVLTIPESRGKIPRHPQCRCAWIPANVGESTTDQKRSKTEITKAVDESIEAEIPQKAKDRTVTQQKDLTKWEGVDNPIAPTRPDEFVVEEPEPQPQIKTKPLPTTKSTPLPTPPKKKTTKKTVKKLTKTEELQKQLEEKKTARKLAEQKLKKSQDKLTATKDKLAAITKKTTEKKKVFKRFEEWEKDLTPDQKFAIAAYTNEDSSQFRKCATDPAKCNKRVKKSVRNLSQALAKGPKYKGKTYRGLNFDTKEEMAGFMAKLKKNDGVFTDLSFTSTTHRRDLAEAFMDDNTSAIGLILEIEGKTGVDLGVLGFDEGKEQEVLFNKGTSFKLQSIKKDDIGQVTVHMAEV